MRNTLCIILLVISTVLCSSAQSSVYKIEGNNTSIYIGGSIHLLREQDYPLPKEFDKAFLDSEILVLETDINEINKPDKAKILLGYTLLPNQITLRTLLSEDVYEELKTACANAGFELDKMNNLKPVMPILTLTMIELGKMGITSSGVDKHYLNKALETDKKMLYLEDVEYQIKLMANMGDGNEDAFVSHSLKDLKESNEMFEEMIEGWKNGTVTELLHQITKFETDYPKLYQSLLVQRNNNWLPKLRNYLNTKETEFVIVGAMHLYGSDGILQLLEDKGYKVEQLK